MGLVTGLWLVTQEVRKGTGREESATSGTQTPDAQSAFSFQVGGLKVESLPHELLTCGHRELPAWIRAESAGALSEGESEAAAGKLGRHTIPSPQIQAFSLWSQSFTGTLQAAEQNISSETRTCSENTTHFIIFFLSHVLISLPPPPFSMDLTPSRLSHHS